MFNMQTDIKNILQDSSPNKTQQIMALYKQQLENVDVAKVAQDLKIEGLYNLSDSSDSDESV